MRTAAQEQLLAWASLLFEVDRRALRLADPPRPPRGVAYAPLTRWDYHVFSDVERRAWIDRGMTDPDLAYECAEAGLTPRQLSVSLGRETVLAWLLAGEPAARVAAALQANAQDRDRRGA